MAKSKTDGSNEKKAVKEKEWKPKYRFSPFSQGTTGGIKIATKPARYDERGKLIEAATFVNIVHGKDGKGIAARSAEEEKFLLERAAAPSSQIVKWEDRERRQDLKEAESVMLEERKAKEEAQNKLAEWRKKLIANGINPDEL